MPYHTPDEIPDEQCTIAITIPDDPVFRRAVFGALIELTRPYNWELYGAITPEETAEAFLDAYNAAADLGCAMLRPAVIGETMFIFHDETPPLWLECAGQAVSRTTYSALFEKLGTLWGAGDGSTTFNLPPAQGRVINNEGDNGTLNSFDKGIGSVVGQDYQTLNVANLPAHAHDITRGSGTAGSGTVRVGTQLFPGVNATPHTTLETGDGTAHNNIQAGIVGKLLIFAGV